MIIALEPLRSQLIICSGLSTPKSQPFLRFAIAMPIARTREIASDFRDKRFKAMLHYDFRVRWKVASDVRF